MLTTPTRKRAVIIGAGPMGFETALRALDRGFEVTMLEAGRVGENIRQWQHVRFFSPFGMNISPRIRQALSGNKIPPDDAILTGGEFVEAVLEPLSRLPAFDGKLHCGQRVVSVARAMLGKMGLPGHPLRKERPFRILTEDVEGKENIFEADLVFDASGVYRQPNWAGTAGMPALGERALGNRIVRHLSDFDGKEFERYAGKSVLLIGHGHSSAHASLALSNILKRAPSTQVTWAVRTDRTKPILEIPDDPLPERASIAEAANALAQAPPQNFRVLRRAALEALAVAPQQPAHAKTQRLKVKLKVWRNFEEFEVDEVIALTGYRPNLEMLRELTAEFSGVSEGVAGLYRALTNVTDCLAKIEINPKDLQSGESNFFAVGIKSYGRNPGFLLKSGVEQLEAIFSLL
ncbi:MAG: NAD(P)/FAD-dependent oxidoreductase [candidate division KSB1 bacterium]|nr:NAD(P)/FAD-dependent oxidoreductase [candidate division KSB1 bacterium]MDZ7364730.1 NAD(P)/FAD-dependent oxidoreductase [candidate division KSB1 bacterium]MDZ7402522.1 NAD(P)/FAD-dependent oxidoreductase [candidate division KSB1 bacterium]